MAIVKQTPAQAAAEADFCAVIDAQADDLAELRRRWPDRSSPESLELLGRLRHRTGPDGESETAMAAVHDAYGGHDHVPQLARDRLEGYLRYRLAHGPRPEGFAATPAMTQEERARALARLLIVGRERRRARLAAEAAAAATPPPAPLTEEEIRRLPRYRPFKRRPRQEPAD